MKSKKSLLLGLISMSIVSQASWSQTSKSDDQDGVSPVVVSNRKDSSKELQRKYLSSELAKLMIRKNITEDYVERRGDLLLVYSLDKVSRGIIGAGLGAGAGMILTWVDAYHLGERHRLGKSLTNFQMNRMVNYLDKGPITNRTVIGSAVIGAVAGVFSQGITNETEVNQINKLKKLNAEEITVEYQSLVEKIKDVVTQLDKLN